MANLCNVLTPNDLVAKAVETGAFHSITGDFYMRYLRSAALCAAAFSLSAAPLVLAKDKVMAPLKVSGQEAAKGVTQVAIGAFNVGFIFKSVDSTKAMDGLVGAMQGTTRAESTLVGITPAMMQTITDAAYADFTAKLKASGYSVQAPAALFGTPLPRAHPEVSPLDVNIALEKKSTGKVTFVKPTALGSMYLIPGDFTGSGMSSIGLNMASAQTAYALNQYAKQAGVGVIDVVYLIDFSQQDQKGGFSVKVNSGVSIASNYSRATLIAPSGKATTIKINDAIPVAGDFATMRDTTGGFAKTTQTATRVLGGLSRLGGLAGMGGMGGLFKTGGATKKIEFDAKPENYRIGATQAATLANERIVAQLNALR